MKDWQNPNVANKGITYGEIAPHSNHFHVDVRPPVLEKIQLAQQLVAQDVSTLDEALPEQALSADTIAEWRQDFGFDEEMMMFVPDIPVVAEQYQTILVAEASAPAAAAVSKTLTVGVCFPVFSAEGMMLSLENAISPAQTALNALYKLDANFKRLLPEQQQTAFDTWGESAKITSLEEPNMGKITRTIPLFPAATNDSYYYNPKSGDMSKDRAVYQVKMGGYTVKLIYTFHPTENGSGPETDKIYCGKRGTLYRIVDGAKKRSALDPAIFAQSIGLGSGNTLPGLVIQTADLSGSAVGQTTATTITLDTNAAGYNWFIDYTPADNSEFLPTANPYEWIAKAGSEAAGKMDMLSVLLHEYGHALGFEHSANSQDFMATTLTPGVRRLPSAEELALMAQLVGEIKTDMTAGSNVPDTPQSPLPSLPLGGAFGLALLGRLRGNRYGGWNVAVDSASLIPQYAVAANPKLSNTEFAGGQGWSTTGDVRFQDGAATLTETAASQTRLNQVFIVTDTDRFLSFTVADTALDDADQAPDDAFEVALLDANTGASLLGGTGLTRNDAFLNLQADGNEHTSQAVTSIRNADGSRTYLVDLAGIPAGTAVNLAFDLIGFGKGAAAVSSHLTIRDLRIGVPQTKDDSATLAEDEVTTIAALANDLNAQQPGFAPVIVDAPAHSQVTINADGTFNFTPDKNWNGEDHFTYKLSDGHVDSNVAIVSLTVTPVNDAPVAVADAANVGEDGTIASNGNLLANDSDVDTGTVLTVAAPGDYVGTYGTLTLAEDGSYSYALANASRGGQTLHAGKVVAAPKLSPHNP